MTRDEKRGLAVVGFLFGVSALNVAGKLAGVLDIGWLAATCPLWGPFVAAFAIRWVVTIAYQRWWEIEKRKAGFE